MSARLRVKALGRLVSVVRIIAGRAARMKQVQIDEVASEDIAGAFCRP
jgi:uncharacterized protein YggU (UPF0235/DUF167 family)